MLKSITYLVDAGNSMLTLLMKPLQETAEAGQPLQTVKEVGNDIYIVLMVTMMVWIGLFIYMLLM